MRNKVIEQRCNFKTLRLQVSSWTKQMMSTRSANNFVNHVIRILSPNVTKSLPSGWQNINTETEAQQWLRERDRESHFLTVQLLSTNEIIGFIFLYESDGEPDYYDLRFGYLLSEQVWGKGLGTELIQGLLNWCKETGDIRSISGGVEADNTGSIKVLKKAGFSTSNVDNSADHVIFYEYQFHQKEADNLKL